MKQVPNILTGMRMVLAMLFLACGAFEHNIHAQTVSLLLLFAASVTDVYDGRLARKYGVITRFGKFMDPIADKVLVTAALIVYVNSNFFEYKTWDAVPAWPVALIISRDFAVTGIRLLAASEGVTLAASEGGKAKTITQMICLHFILVVAIFENYSITFFGVPLDQLAAALGRPQLADLFTAVRISVPVMIYAMLLITLHSGYRYLSENYRLILKAEQP